MYYFLHWIDRYVNGYRAGCTHASIEGGKSLCGIDYSKHPVDGGYNTTKDYDVECKKCKRIIDKQ